MTQNKTEQQLKKKRESRARAAAQAEREKKRRQKQQKFMVIDTETTFATQQAFNIAYQITTYLDISLKRKIFGYLKSLKRIDLGTQLQSRVLRKRQQKQK